MVPLRKIDTVSVGASSKAELPRVRTAVSPLASPASVPGVALANARVMNASVVLHSIVLSGIAGYVDAAGFVLLLGIFPAHLTGEIVAVALAFSSGQLAARASRLWIFPVFVGSVALAALVARLPRRAGHKALTSLLALVTLSLALFSSTDELARVFHEGRLPTLLTGSFAVAAMGFQTALMRESLTGSCPTTVMTGNLAQVVAELVDHALARITRTADRPVAMTRLRLASISSALFAFAGCAALGSWLVRVCGSLSIVLPTLVAATLTARSWREEKAAALREALNVVAPTADALPWFTDEELWLDSDPPLALSQPYTEPSSETRIKAERVVPADAEPPLPRRA